MRAGKLRHRITLQSLADGQEAPFPSGAPDQYWEDSLTVSASINPLAGRELFAAQQYNSEVTHSIRMRYRTGVTDRMRVKFGARLFTLHYIRNIDERNVEFELLCSEGLVVEA